MDSSTMMMGICKHFGNNGFNIRNASGIEMMNNKYPCIIIQMQALNYERIKVLIYDTRIGAPVCNTTVETSQSLKEAVINVYNTYKRGIKPFAIVGKVFTGHSITHYVLQDMQMNTSEPMDTVVVKNVIKRNEVQGALLQNYNGKEIIRLKFNDVPAVKIG